MKREIIFSIGNLEITGPLWMMFPVVLIALLGLIYSIYWIYNDARKRKKNNFLAILFLLFTGWPISILWWLWLRPKNKRQS